jgi:hypothetical protein
MRRLSVVTWTLASTLMVAGAACSDDMTDPDPRGGQDQEVQGPADLPASAVAQIEALLAEKEARTPTQRKISSQLLYLASGRFDAVRARRAPSKQLQSMTERDAAGRVLVDIKADPAVRAKIEALGGKIEGTSAAHRSIRAWVRLDSIEQIAADASVSAVRPALQAMTQRADAPGASAKFRSSTRAERVAAVQAMQRSLRPVEPTPAPGGPRLNVGAATSEGSAAHGADRARKFFNADGTGVTIGVLSDSDDFKEQSIATGDLPPDTVTIPGQDGRPGTGEGTAMMEIVHDVAPGAKIVFATAFLSPESFADNIRRLRFEFGCDIIVDDVIYFFENPFQDDIIAQAVDDVTADGALYFSSAGNQGNFNDGTSGTWEGDFKAGGTLAALPTGYTVHDFGGGAVSNRVELLGGPLILHWSDPGSLDNPLSGNDYDLFVLDEDLTNVLVAATDVQDGDDIPFEFLGFLIPPELRVVVARHPGAQKRTVRTMLFGGEMGISTAGATYGHSQATNAVGVAAVDVAQAEGGEFVGGPTTPVELFSSDGFRRIFYDRNGVPLRGGVSGNGGIVRKKPDLAAADGVSTTLPPFSGLNPFFGTSAAAPHAAAIAGLMKSAVPTATAAKIRASLLASALDIEAAGRDRDSGTGIASAFNALDRAGARPAVFLELGPVVATPTTGDAILPGTGGVLSVTLVNNGGATANAVRGTLFSDSPFVTIGQATSTFPGVAPNGTTTNATPFEFFVSPSAPCGEKVGFQLAVSFNGRGTSPTLFSFSVQTGRPSATPATFSYSGAPAAIPDGNGVGVDVPLEVSGTSGISRLAFHIDGATCSTAIGSTEVGVDHTWVGDLVFRLTSPGGTTVTLINQAGGVFNDGNNYCQTLLDDGAADSIQDVTPDQAPYTGTFAPANPQDAFVGEDANGTWTLNVSDLAFFDIGNVRAFSIDVSGFDCSAP